MQQVVRRPRPGPRRVARSCDVCGAPEASITGLNGRWFCEVCGGDLEEGTRSAVYARLRGLADARYGGDMRRAVREYGRAVLHSVAGG